MTFAQWQRIDWELGRKSTRSSHPEAFCKKRCSYKFHKIDKKTSARVSCFNKTAGIRPQACNFIEKDTLTHVFSCEFCEICKNTFSYRTPPLAASDWRRSIFQYLLWIKIKIKSKERYAFVIKNTAIINLFQCIQPTNSASVDLIVSRMYALWGFVLQWILWFSTSNGHHI